MDLRVFPMFALVWSNNKVTQANTNKTIDTRATICLHIYLNNSLLYHNHPKLQIQVIDRFRSVFTPSKYDTNIVMDNSNHKKDR